jgi:hypothetical protein
MVAHVSRALDVEEAPRLPQGVGQDSVGQDALQQWQQGIKGAVLWAAAAQQHNV